MSILNWKIINSENVESMIWREINGEEIFPSIDENHSKEWYFQFI